MMVPKPPGVPRPFLVVLAVAVSFVNAFLVVRFLGKRIVGSGAGPVAQRITRLTTDQKIAGSNPAWVRSLPFWVIRPEKYRSFFGG